MTNRPTKPPADTSKKAPPDVLPLEGWKVQTSFGTLQTRSGEKLVRLEDVHIWLCGNGKPPKDAVYEVFSPFYKACLAHAEDGDSAALALPGALQLINAATYPNGVFNDGDVSKVQAVRFYSSAFPALGHIRLADGSVGGLVYAMAEGALRVWHGHADISTDHLEAVKRRKERKTDETYGIQWPSDEDLRKLLGRLAVPISTAYELWGWGSVAEVVRLHAVPKVDAEPTTWTELVEFRKSHSQTEWTTAQKHIAAAEATRRKNVPGATGVAVAMANELDVTVSRFNGLIRNPNEAGKRKTQRNQSA